MNIQILVLCVGLGPGELRLTFFSILYADKHDSEFLSTSWIHIVDSGGQPEFHDVLPFLVKKASLVIFVLKASEGLGHKPIAEYYDPEGCVGEPRESYLTNKQILEQCLKAFHADDGQVPNILMIGTHIDCKPQLLEIVEVAKCLKHISKKKVIHFGSAPIALIDSLSQSDAKKQMMKIRKEIEGLDGETKKTPLAWFGLELALKNASQSAKLKGILTLKECEVEAKNFSFFKHNNGQFEAALQHLVDNNIFLYYPEVLPDIVFCDPQVLLTMVTKIVRHHYMLKTSEELRHGDMLTFVSDGCITLEVLKRIMDSNDIITPELLLKLLSFLRIISVICDSAVCRVYLMPALLLYAENPVDNVVPIHGKNELQPLCILFEGGCAPSGLFCSLVASLLRSKDWMLCISDDKPSCCFRNCIAFTYCIHNVVTVVDLFSHFRIYVQTHLKKIFQICQEIKHIIHTFIRDAKISFKDAIKCPSHPKQKHVALQDEDGYQCTVYRSSSGFVPEEYQVWEDTKSTCTGGMYM